MIDYSLAKKLKDAGYNQEGTGGYLIFKTTTTGTPFPSNPNSDSCYAPTLSELLEALPCKIKYRNENGLYFMLSKLVPKGYRAYYEGLGGGEGIDKELDFTADAPEEAVGNLLVMLLELNKN